MVLTVALGLILFALVKLTLMLGQLRDEELGALGTDGELHSVAWEVDVAMRHGQQACSQEAAEAGLRVREGIDRKVGKLRASLGELDRASPGIRKVSLGYVELGERVLAGDVCVLLPSAGVQRERASLDEELTNHWVGRLSELSDAIQLKDDEARALGKMASFGGVALAAIAFWVALLLAHRLARDVVEPLGELAGLARRVGRGDFDGRVEVSGPAEVVELAQELEGMRARLAELDSLKQGFLASVSHELRTPLSKIREALALLSDGATGPLAERQARVVDIARVACEREIRMVTTLLDFSRLRAGAPLRLLAGTSLDALVQSAVRDEREDAAARKVDIELEIEGEVPAMSLDGALLERAIANLVRNAVGVSKAKQRVLVRRELLGHGPSGEDGRWARVAVVDRGPGVAPDIRDRIFDAFVTHAVPKSPKAIGVGLGLALAREVARAHGGELLLAETGPTGTAFHLWLPLDRRRPTEQTEAAPFATLVPLT
jgi:two-component system sensor histidine kinase GlrK